MQGGCESYMVNINKNININININKRVNVNNLEMVSNSTLMHTKIKTILFMVTKISKSIITATDEEQGMQM